MVKGIRRTRRESSKWMQKIEFSGSMAYEDGPQEVAGHADGRA